MLEMSYGHTVANFKFYRWLSEGAKNAIRRGMSGLEDWQQERASEVHTLGRSAARLWRPGHLLPANPGAAWHARARTCRANRDMKLASGVAVLAAHQGFP